jgi:RNA polymerase sigma factor (sigma-70 family)
MATSTLNPVIDHLRRVVLLRDGAALTDGQLLESFLGHKDAAAFEALVRRHGPMVLGVCRRILRNHHDAEDAFQTTFIVLVRKAGSVEPREMIANWLYGVAYRTASKARSMIAKQRLRERRLPEMPEPEAAEADHCWHDLQPLLDQELSRLPDKYRSPIVLCDLEGKTGKEAARQLGWPEGTVASRLSRGRGLLARRLTRRGLAVSVGSLAAVLSHSAASASVPASLVFTTVKAAVLLAADQAFTAGLISAKVATLTEGVLKAMLLNKVKIVLVVCAVIGVVGTGLGTVSFRVRGDDQPAARSDQQQVAQADGKQSNTAQPNQDRADDPGKKKADEKKPADQDQVKQALDMIIKGFQAYQDSKDGDKKTERPDKAAIDLYGEPFLKAFQISSEIAKARGKRPVKIRADDDAIFDAYRSAFMQAYERAKILKESLEVQKASGGKGSDKAIDALDVFLTAGREFEHTVKLRAKAQAVEHARNEIENALSRVEKMAHDRQTTLETLDEIERAVKDMRTKVQGK